MKASIFILSLFVLIACSSKEEGSTKPYIQKEKKVQVTKVDLEQLKLKESKLFSELVKLSAQVIEEEEVATIEYADEVKKITYQITLKNAAEAAAFTNFEILVEGLALSKSIVTTATKHHIQALEPGKEVSFTMRLPMTDELHSYRFKLVDGEVVL